MNDIDELLTRGVDKIYPSKDELEKVLKSGKKLRLYQGFDPTGDKLHVGHMVGLRKLAQWQKMGHNVIFLIGDGTGQAGDPSGKTSARDRFMTRDELRDNAKDYVLQAGKIIDFDAPNVEILYNSDWLNKLSLVDVLDLMKHFSLGQLSERDLFVERKKKGEEVGLREAFYPVLQAYDSVAMNVDLEIGGTDQTFNMLAGRKLVREMKGKDKFVMTTPLLTDSKGNKIGKTEGNIIALTDEPFELYRKIMAQGDDIIVKGLEYLTDIPMEEIKNTEDQLEKGGNPIEFKKTLAFEVTKQLNSEADAKKAQAEFERVVQKGEAPRDLLEIEIKEDIKIDEDLLVKHGLANSKSDAKRLFEQNAVRKDGKKISSGTKAENGILNVGRKAVKLKLR